MPKAKALNPSLIQAVFDVFTPWVDLTQGVSLYVHKITDVSCKNILQRYEGEKRNNAEGCGERRAEKASGELVT